MSKKYVPKFMGENRDLFVEMKFYIGVKDIEKFRNTLKRLISAAKNNIDLYDIYFICDFELKREKLDSFHQVLIEELDATPSGFELPFDDNVLEDDHKAYLIENTEGFYQKRNRNLKIFLIIAVILIVILLLQNMF